MLGRGGGGEKSFSASTAKIYVAHGSPIDAWGCESSLGVQEGMAQNFRLFFSSNILADVRMEQNVFSSANINRASFYREASAANKVAFVQNV